LRTDLYDLDMIKHVIFFQGGAGQEDYDADGKLVASLKLKLGSTYLVHYPLLSEEEAPDFGRRKQIGHEISIGEDDVILVGHSLGASMLLIYLSENKVRKKIAGIFLLSTAFWSGDEDWIEPLKLPPAFAERLDKKTPLFFYHCQDDEVVPFAQLAIYKRELPWASFREISVGGHQLDNDLTIVANDIKSL
jgi:predicted alpha/beta hydrolase family esterase